AFIDSPPIATSGSASTPEDTAALITLAGSDPEGDPLTFKITDLPDHGKLFRGNSTSAGNQITSVPTSLSGSQVTYLPNANYNGPDSFQFKANDGIFDSAAAATVSITVGAVNDAPVLAAIESSALSYTEADPAAAITSSLTVADLDSPNLAGATVQITSNCTSPQDVLGFTTQNGISGVYTAASCLLTLSGSSSVANYQTALRSVTYSNSSNNPNSATRTVTFQVDDGAASNTQTRNITIISLNDAPVLANIESSALAYSENGAAAAITSALTISDTDSPNLAG